MKSLLSLPGLRPGAVLLIALSLAIGWGIRGNFGHESGAMIAGVLAGVAAGVVSGREDWRRRIAFVALFSGLGWGFGGSISYLYNISFAGSEQWQTCIYGFFSTFFCGLLWAMPGGLGAALPLTMERKRLDAFMMPVVFTLAAMIVSHLWVQPYFAANLRIPGAELMDRTWHRHHNPLYWFDSDWFPACAALVGVCLYDLWERRLGHWRRLLLYACAGAVGGALLYRITGAIGINALTARIIVVPLGDVNAINPDTGLPFGVGSMLTNWPNFAHYYPQHLGWLIGVPLGIAFYFRKYGAWRNDARFILYLACGWFAAFFLMPVLGSIPLQSFGGFRLTPPRGDNWAGVFGMCVAGGWYCLRRNLGGATLTGVITGVVGGFFFAFVPFLRALLRYPGNPYRTPGGTPEGWAHYQSANWHSVMEQLQGFGFGIALAVALGVLAWVADHQEKEQERKRWTELFCVTFVLFFITLMNVFKNVRDWTEVGARVVPEVMKTPFIASLEFSASAWFLFTWAALSFSIVGLMLVHVRRPLAIMPPSWMARGQILYLAFLWIMVIANFERALVNFHENRLVTEWVIIMTGALATFMIVALPGDSISWKTVPVREYGSITRRFCLYATPIIIASMFFMAVSIRMLYQDAPLDSPSGNHKRWGEEAQWRMRPILRDGQHR